jgi:hypothetical protein
MAEKDKLAIAPSTKKVQNAHVVNNNNVSPGLTFQSPARDSLASKAGTNKRESTPSPSFGSSPIRDARSYGGIGSIESPNSSFSTNLRTWIGDDDINNFLDSTSVHQKRYKNQELQHLGDTIAVIQNDMQAQIDALSVKVTQWRSKDQKDMYRDRELLLEGMRNSSDKIKNIQIKQNEIDAKLLDMAEEENNNKNVNNNNNNSATKTLELVDPILISRIKASLDKFELQEHTMDELRNKMNSIGEKQQVINLDLNQLQETVENAVSSLQNQVHNMLHVQQTIVKEISNRDKNDRLLKEEIKRIEMLFTELSKSQQITEETSKIFMDEIIVWKKEADMHNNSVMQNMNRLSNSYSHLRNDANQNKINERRFFKGLHASVEICEEEIRKLKKQLTLAVKLFRKRNDNFSADGSGIHTDTSLRGSNITRSRSLR